MTKSTYHIFFGKLSNKLRVDIISILEKKQKSVNELSRELKVEQSKISHALKELKSCNIVNFEKKGKQRIYKLSKSIIPILRLIDYHAKKCNRCWGCGG